MKLSIISCTYNSEKYLQKCINSVINQNLDVSIFEHIFVDAYSTDNTKKIIEEYKQKYPNVKLIEREPKWVYNAMNEWIKEAKWEYILCLNSDDWLEKDVLAGYLLFIKQNNNKDLYYADLIFHEKESSWQTNNNNVINKILFKMAWMNCLIFHPSVLIKKSTFMNLWMFDESKKIASDYWLWLNIMKNRKKCVYYPKVVTNFLVHNWWISSNRWNQSINQAECEYFQKKYLPVFKRFIRSFILLVVKIKKCFLSN